MDDQARVKAVHGEYFQALGSGNMDALAEKFTFPAVFKGFLDNVVIATDKDSLVATYQSLIAAAPKAERSEILGLEVARLRPNVHMLTMSYEQYGADDVLIHKGKAVYFMKEVNGDFRIFAVF